MPEADLWGVIKYQGRSAGTLLRDYLIDASGYQQSFRVPPFAQAIS
jgi:hypothetical protein